MYPVTHLQVDLGEFDPQFGVDISGIIHSLVDDLCTHLSDKDGGQRRA